QRVAAAVLAQGTRPVGYFAVSTRRHRSTLERAPEENVSLRNPRRTLSAMCCIDQLNPPSRLCENSWVAKNVISDGPREFDLTRLSGLERTQTELWRTPADRSREFSHSLGRTVTSGLAGAELSHDGAKFGQLRSVTARIPLPQCGRCRFAPVQSGLRRGRRLLHRHGVVFLDQHLEARIDAQRGVRRIDGEVVAADRNGRTKGLQPLQQRRVLAERGVHSDQIDRYVLIGLVS